MVETGRSIHGRYLLQRLVQRGQACAVYQGSDQVLQRVVAIKLVPLEHIASYQAAIRTTAQFTHPNIVGVYDLIIEPEIMYIVQEYVDGDDFTAVLQSQPGAYHVADMGVQICQSLMYAGSPARKICHGDLTPAAIIRDRRGLVRVNNFALPSDLSYFSGWGVIGADGGVLSDQELSWGEMSEGRKDDDTRAVGLLLYQMLAGRAPGAPSVEPPPDGRLRFMRNVPPELCEIIARAVVRQHPQHIRTPETLYKELKVLAEALEPPLQPPVMQQSSAYRTEGLGGARAFAPTSTGSLASSLPARETGQVSTGALGFAQFRPGAANTPIAALESSPSAPTMADMSVKLAEARQAAYANESPRPARKVNLPVLLGVGFVLFLLFFVIGYFLAHAIFP